MNADNARKILQLLEVALGGIASALPGDGPAVAKGLAVAAGLAADLIGIGEDPVAAITEIRSSLPDFDRVTRALTERANARARRAPR